MAKDNGGVIGVLNTPTSTSASGVWQLMSEYQAVLSGTWPLTRSVGTNSARFNSGSSDSLTRTPSSATNKKTWTWSFWFKISYINPNGMYIFGASQDGNNRTAFGYNFASVSGDAKIWFHNRTASTFNTNLITTQVFRDISAWYHLVVAVDTTQATSSNRAKIYLNGSQITALDTATYPSQNTDTWVNSANAHAIGKYSGGASDFVDGYIADAYLIDGQQLDPSSFGQTDSTTGIWTPIAYQGTYGTNGFYLNFSNASSLGTDASGNGNNFTVNNLTSADQTKDRPTNNFATLNPLDTSGGKIGTMTEGNLQAANPNNADDFLGRGTIAVDKGKWYWEVKCVSRSGSFDNYTVGIDNFNSPITSGGAIGTTAGSYAYYANGGTKVNNNSYVSYGATFTAGDIIGVALDMDSGTLIFYKNGTSQGTAFTSLSGLFTPAISDTGSVTAMTMAMNFGYPPYSVSGGYSDANGYGNFTYQPPSGYLSLCTNNLASNG